MTYIVGEIHFKSCSTIGKEFFRYLLNVSYFCLLQNLLLFPIQLWFLGGFGHKETLRASPHHISTLSACSAPSTVRRLRSFIGAYKALARVFPQCACMIGSLDDGVAGQSSSTSIQWTDELLKLLLLNATCASHYLTLPYVRKTNCGSLQMAL